MTDDADVAELMRIFDEASAAFNAKDVDGYLGSAHPSAWTYQAAAFMPVAALKEVAAAIFEASERFEVTHWLGGVVVGDAGAVWGECAYKLQDVDVATKAKFSAHYVRVDGAWQVLFSHYTPFEG